MELNAAQVERYLAYHFGAGTRLLDIVPLGKEGEAVVDGEEDPAPLKRFGYGQPLLLRYERAGQPAQAILNTQAQTPFGHEYRSDRAANLLLSYDTSNLLPKHVTTLDVGMLLPTGSLRSLAEGGEFFVLVEFAEGQLYALDLQRLQATGALTPLDCQRSRALARYLAQIHHSKHTEPTLYRRHIRDMLGSGEGIMGLADSYPYPFSLAEPGWLERVEQRVVHWRWRSRHYDHRLCQIHGDFHPFNILFGGEDGFRLLDRSRSPWGEPADDVGCLAINYLFFSLQRSGELAPPFTALWETFWESYLSETGDWELLEAVIPFFVWRALVLASPTWYYVTDEVRLALLRFIDAILREETFDPEQVNRYLEG